MTPRPPEGFEKDQAGLIVSYGNQPRKFRPLNRDLIVIGSAPGCELGIEAAGVAPIHCVIIRGATAFHIRNCATRAGTRLNGTPIQESKLHHTDVLQIGPFVLEMHLPDAYFADSVETGHTLVLDRESQRLQRSRRRLVQLALAQRRRLRAARAARRLAEAKPETVPHLADLRRQTEILRNQIRDWDDCVRRMDQAEQQLTRDREALEQDRAALQARTLQLEREQQGRLAELERELWAQFDRQRAQAEQELARDRALLQEERSALLALRLQAEQELEQHRAVVTQELQEQYQHHLTEAEQELARARAGLQEQQQQLEQAGERLAKDRHDVQARAQAVELAERQLSAVCAAVEQERANQEQERLALQARLQQGEQELARRRTTLETELTERWRAFQQRCQEMERAQTARLQQLAAAAPTATSEEEHRLNIRRRELGHYAQHLQTMHKALHRQAQRLAAVQQQLTQEWQQLQEGGAGSAAEDKRQVEIRRAELDQLAQHLRTAQQRLREERELLTAQAQQFRQQQEEWRREQEAASAHLAQQTEAFAQEETALQHRHREVVRTLTRLEEAQQALVAEHKVELEALEQENAKLRRQLAAQELGPVEASAKGALRATEDVAELRDEVDQLRQQLADRDAVIQGLRGERPGGEDFSSLEVELNLFRRQLEADRRNLNAELRQVQARKAEQDETARKLELEISRERATLARERAWLDRLREEVRTETERLRREADLRERLAPVQALADQERGRAPADGVPQTAASTGSMWGRFGGKRS